MNKNRGLGKGLGALLPNFEDENKTTPQEIEIILIDTNPFQPRKEFADDKINELADSIRIHGIIQPLIVREFGNRYQLIAGERRFRAAKLVGLTSVPVVVREMTDQIMMEVALVENIQRENLNPLEEAEAYQRLIYEFHLTQEEIAKRVGKSRSAVANFLRLLNLPQEIQADLSSGTLTMGHARALLGLKSEIEQQQIWEKVKTDSLSVRGTEDLIRQVNDPQFDLQEENVSRETFIENEPEIFSEIPSDLKQLDQIEQIVNHSLHNKNSKDPDLINIEEELQSALGTKVQVKSNGSSGKIEIEFYSHEDFERIYEKLMGI